METYKFYKTGREFNNQRSFINHVRAYCNKHDLIYDDLIKENKRYYLGILHCKHCGKQIDGGEVCYDKECYIKYILDHLDVYIDLSKKQSFIDPYDDTHFGKPFTQRFCHITKRITDEIDEFFAYKQCEVCDNEIKYNVFKHTRINKTCSHECRYLSSQKSHLLRFSELKGKIKINFIKDFEQSDIVTLNHQIHDLKLPQTVFSILEYPELCKPHELEYFDLNYNLWFYSNASSSFNSLKRFLKLRNIDYVEYLQQNHLSIVNSICESCGKVISIKDVFGHVLGKKGHGNKFCSHTCYTVAMREGKYDYVLQDKAKHKRQSETMKQLVASGEFTPGVINSLTRKPIILNKNGVDKRFRSSWEVAFYVINQHLLYETIRIPYVDKNGKKRNYIVDFFDEDKKILYEVKPKAHRETENNIRKYNAAIEYCQSNGLQYKVIDENDLKKLLTCKENLDIIQQNLDSDTLNLFFRGIGYECNENQKYS